MKSHNDASGKRFIAGTKYDFDVEPTDGKGNSLVKLSQRDLERGKKPAFEKIEEPKKPKQPKKPKKPVIETTTTPK